MFEGIKSFYDIFTSKTNSVISKFTFFISLLVFLLFIDFSFNLTFNYFLNNKLNQLEMINKLKNNYNEDEDKLRVLRNMENEILISRHYLSFLNEFKKNVVLLNDNSNQNLNSNTSKITDNRSFILMYLSSGSLLFILSIYRVKTGLGGHGTVMDFSFCFLCLLF